MKRDDLIAMLQSIPSNVDVQVQAKVKTKCSTCEWWDEEVLDFKIDGIRWGEPARIQVWDARLK